MMKRALPFLTLFLFLLAINIPLAAQEQTIDQSTGEAVEDEDDAPVPRVARLSFVKGEVSFLRAGVNDWAEAVENLPLLAGDQLYVGRDARAEIQLARGSYVRLSENTALAITALADDAAQFEITEGIAIIRVERLSSAFKRFEVDTPNAALLLQDDGLYRINVKGDDDSEVIVRRGAAEVSTNDGSFKVREGHRLLVDSSTSGRLEIALDASTDDWDQWSYERDVLVNQTYAVSQSDSVTSYETTYNSFYGASDLGSYGSWFNDSDYGYCWRPRVSYDWVPYRDGQWLWIPATGWTWLSHERWGWAPYHYGRWVHVSRYGWSWVPGIYLAHQQRTPWFFANPYRYYRWRPALVRFYDYQTPRGRYVAWNPLAPHERWRRPDRDRRDNDHSHLRYPSGNGGGRRADDDRLRARLPRDERGMSTLPVEGLTRPDRSRIRPEAPGREASDWIRRGARAGLSEIKPTPIASAPSFEGTERAGRRIAIPPKEVIGRSVVIRNRPTEGQTGISGPHRERRLLMPRPPESTESAARRVRKLGGGESNRPRLPVAAPGEQQGSDDGKDRPSRKPRILLPTPAEKTGEDDSTSDRARRREENTAGRQAEKPSDSDANEQRNERRRNRSDAPATQDESRPRDENPQREQRRQERQERRQQEEQQQQERRQQRLEERQRNRDEDSHKSRERSEQPSRSAEPRQERPQPPPENKAERREERRQERQEERQSRRKPD